MSLLPGQAILGVIKPKFGTALARFCAENKCWQPELANKCIPQLSFQQRHDTGNRSPILRQHFCPSWANVGPYLTLQLGSTHFCIIQASQTGPYIPYCPLYSVEVPKVPYFHDLVPKVPYFQTLVYIF